MKFSATNISTVNVPVLFQLKFDQGVVSLPGSFRGITFQHWLQSFRITRGQGSGRWELGLYWGNPLSSSVSNMIYSFVGLNFYEEISLNERKGKLRFKIVILLLKGQWRN